jgi:hypothetical protein
MFFLPRDDSNCKCQVAAATCSTSENEIVTAKLVPLIQRYSAIAITNNYQIRLHLIPFFECSRVYIENF